MYGLFGIVSLLRCESPQVAEHPRARLTLIRPAADYLVVITKRKKVATVLGTAVFAAQDFSVFPIERSTTVALLGQPDESYLLGLLKSHLYSAPFYFTYGGYDVTKRLQEQTSSDAPFYESVSSPLRRSSPSRRGLTPSHAGR